MDALGSLIERLPPGTVSTHPGELATRARDRWALARLRDVRGDRVAPPAAVVFPASTEEVAAVLAWAAETGTPVVPRGGGTGTTGAAQAVVRSVVLDLSRMDHVLGVDEVSQTAHVQAGVTADELETTLAPRGLTTGLGLTCPGHSTVGGWIAAGASGLASPGFGSVEDLVVGLVAVLAGGEVVRLKATPRSGAGPDLRRLFVGSEGTLGVVTEATLALSRLPQAAWESFRPHSFESGAALAREVVQRRFPLLALELLDQAEVDRAFPGSGLRGPLLLAGVDAGAPAVEGVRFALKELAHQLGARPLGPEPGEHRWERRRDDEGWLEEVMGEERALGTGVVADVMDLGCLWRRVPAVYADVRGALLDRAEYVGVRLAHPTRAGAGLRFTFAIRAGDDHEVEGAYREAWAEAVGAALGAGASLTHHLGVGVLKAPFLGSELGPAGLRALTLVRRALDPGGILNPGKQAPP